MHEPTEIPVIVIGSATTAMSCIRLIAQADFPVYGACQIGAWPTRTRYFSPPPSTGGRVWRGELGEEGHGFLRAMPFQQCVLVPAADDAAIWVAELPADLRERYLISSSSGETLHLLQDKADFTRLTSELGIPAPMSFTIDNENSLDNVPFDAIEALFLKPTDSQAFVNRYNKKALWVENIVEAKSEWRRVCNDGMALIAQEYIAGSAADHYFIDGFRCRDGIVRAMTARRRLRIYPPDFGNSSYCESVPFEDVDPAWEGLHALLRHVNYRGIFSAEFKKDSRSGQFKILEVNTRPWVYIEFASICGMNMCDLYIHDALGQELVTTKAYKSGRGCVNLYDDLVAVVEMPSSDRPSLIGLLSTWTRSFKLLFSWRDPWPATVFIARTLRAKVRKALSR